MALTTSQNALSTTAEQIFVANSGVRYREVKNLEAGGGINIFIGADNTVSASNGHQLRPGESFGLEGFDGSVWAIAASGTPSVSLIEW